MPSACAASWSPISPRLSSMVKSDRGSGLGKSGGHEASVRDTNCVSTVPEQFLRHPTPKIATRWLMVLPPAIGPPWHWQAASRENPPTASARAELMETRSPPCAAKRRVNSAWVSMVTALTTRRPRDGSAVHAASSTPSAVAPPPTKIASGGGNPPSTRGASPSMMVRSETRDRIARDALPDSIAMALLEPSRSSTRSKSSRNQLRCPKVSRPDAALATPA